MEKAKRVIVRIWTASGYHKDVAILDAEQVRMSYQGMEAGYRQLVPPLNAIRVVVNPGDFPEAKEFEVIVERE